MSYGKCKTLASTILKKGIVNKFDASFSDEVIEQGSKTFSKADMQTVRACMQCGTCVASCPSGRRTAWRIRQIFLKTQRGLRDEILSDPELWNCTTCYTCQERCPREVKTTDIIRVIRNLAVHEGFMTKNHVMICDILFKQGHAVPVNDKIKAYRKDLGLQEVPPTVHQYPEALEEVNKILEETGFKAKVKKEK
ncbi:MAG: CoB--CoM heterodisulfide reductase subunit C [Candidatus Bathyarchaeota archaeon]